MRTIYIDSDFKCYVTNDGTLTAVEVRDFDGKCDTFIEGCRYIPAGKKWVREDGEVFEGESFSPWKDSTELEEAQRAYEQERLADAENALAILLGGDIQ